MDINKVKSIAKSKGINTGNKKKAAIIKTIQRTEGNFDCFGSAAVSGYCDQNSCLWRKDCFSSNSR